MKKQDTKTTDSKPHYALLDGLRGVAALLVVWYHVFEGFQFAGNKPVIDFINHGYLAVDFFFILSGFVVGYAYDSRWGKTLTLGGFFRRRLIRLQPMVIMGAVIGAASFLISGMERWDGTHATLWLTFLAFVCGCLMLPALPGMPREVRGNGEMFPLNGPCWSLFFEYVGNIVYALFIRHLSTRLLAVLSFALCCALAWFAVTDQSGYGSIGVGWTVDRTNILGGMLRMLCPFTMGILMSRLFKPLRQARGAFWTSAALLLIIFHIPYIYSDGALSLNGVFEAACIIAVFPLVVWYAASGKTTDIASTRICRFLGDISYPLYIVHYPLMYAFYMWLIKTRQYTLYETWPAALAAVTASIILAWLCLKLYDMPVRKWLRNL
ncbi:acyltransferase family protein [Prevotella sp. 885]|uniref:acyltransferase family protein n=1 Tax=Prevotella sp. 885 TaxID=2022527 RepID=UPI000B9FE3B3|nr:acyltransferase [Prevotella sp. 885]OZT03920.1 acyltransferase [Prevotella sp. 885]